VDARPVIRYTVTNVCVVVDYCQEVKQVYEEFLEIEKVRTEYIVVGVCVERELMECDKASFQDKLDKNDRKNGIDGRRTHSTVSNRVLE